VKRAPLLAVLLIAALSACDGRHRSAPLPATKVAFELNWRYQRRGQQTEWNLTCAGDHWVHAKVNYQNTDTGFMEGAFMVSPAYLQDIRREADEQHFFELPGMIQPRVTDDSRPMTVINLTMTVDGKSYRVHVRDPRDVAQVPEYRRFHAVFDAIVGSLPAGPPRKADGPG
jgi:hypothetical protein